MNEETNPNYKSENCSVDYCSDMTPEEAECVIGKTIDRIDASEYGLLITFSDKTTLNMSGGRWGGCSMGVDYESDWSVVMCDHQPVLVYSNKTNDDYKSKGRRPCRRCGAGISWDKNMEKFTIDMRTRQIETREIRDGNKMLFQGRSNIINLDGSIEEGEWRTNGVSENYGDCLV